MTTLILLCGQGSTGKSTFAKNILLYYKLISYDDYQDWAKMVKAIQEEINKGTEGIVVDYAFDTISSRFHLLNSLHWAEMNLVVIQMRPPVEKVIEWHGARGNQALSDDEKAQIRTVYYHFQFATLDEFRGWRFRSIRIYLYDNSADKVLHEINLIK